MDREIIRRVLSAFLMDTNETNTYQCNITIGNSYGLSSLDLPIIINMFQDPIEGIIYFYLQGDCLIEFDDIETEDLISICNQINQNIILID